MNLNHSPQEVAATIKEIIKEQYGNLSAYAKNRKITPTQLYSILNGKEYISLLSAVHFSIDLDLNYDYCTKGQLPIYDAEHDYNMLNKAAREFFFAVRDEDRFIDEYINQHERLTQQEIDDCRIIFNRLRMQKSRAATKLLDLLNIESNDSNHETFIEKPPSPKNSMKLHEAIQEVIRRKGRPLTFAEIASNINDLGLYFRKDGKPLQASQISARISHYPQLFSIINTHPITINLNKF